MNINIDSLWVIIVFILYVVLWKIKKAEMLKYGIDPYAINKAEKPIQIYFSQLERIMTIAIAVILVMHLFLEENIFFKRLFPSIEGVNIYIGFGIAVSGLVLCRIAQVTMGNSWRVGIDDTVKPGLVSIGIFKYIRNPTYTGLFLVCIGVFVIMPTILLSYWIVAFFFIMEFQVRNEEEYLEREYGSQYIGYKKKVKRYIPFVW